MLTVSIVTYNTDLEELTRCLDSLSSTIIDKITIVDNSSQDYINQFITQRNDSRLTYIPSENKGFGAGHNQAINNALKCHADYHLVLNSDVRFDPDVLDVLVDYMNLNPDTGLVHPLLLYPDGSRQFTARALPTPYDLILRRFFPSSWFKKSRDKYLLKHINLTNPFEAGYVQGSFMLIRLDILRKCGLFDERFFMYPEDIDLSRRIGEFAKVECLPTVTVIHDHRKASYHSWRMLRIHLINMIRYFNKWGWFSDKYRRIVNKRLK